MLSSGKVRPHDQMHWLKTLIFTHLQFIKAVASDQHNYTNNIKMIKGVHQLTLCPNMLTSLIDHFTIFNGWMDGQPDGSRIFVRGRGSRPDGQNTGSAHGTNTYVHTHGSRSFVRGRGSRPKGQNTGSAHGTNTHTHAHTHTHTHKHTHYTHTHTHECSCTGRQIDIHEHV